MIMKALFEKALNDFTEIEKIVCDFKGEIKDLCTKLNGNNLTNDHFDCNYKNILVTIKEQYHKDYFTRSNKELPINYFSIIQDTPLSIELYDDEFIVSMSYKDLVKANKNFEDLTEEELWKLRKEIVLNSLYLSDYTNSYYFNTNDLSIFFDGYIDYLYELADEDDFSYDDLDELLREYDNDTNLYSWFNCYDDLSWIKKSL